MNANATFNLTHCQYPGCPLLLGPDAVWTVSVQGTAPQHMCEAHASTAFVATRKAGKRAAIQRGRRY